MLDEDNHYHHTVFRFNVNYHKKLLTYTYFGYGDLVSKLGGVKAALGPVL